jgi:hypothetical protein
MPGGVSQGRPKRVAWSAAGAVSRFVTNPAIQPPVKKPSAIAYHGSRTKPAQPIRLQAIALR